MRVFCVSSRMGMSFAEVIDLLVHIVAHCAGSVAALRLENANSLALAFHGAALRVNRLHIFVGKNHRAGVLGVVGRRSLGRIQAPLRHGLGLVVPTGNAGL